MFGKRKRIFREPWYHDFSVLGVPTPQREGIFKPNQDAKVPILFDYVKRAVTPGCRGIELFCADGLYSHYALQCGAGHMTGWDIGLSRHGGLPIHLEQAQLMGRLLKHADRCTFEARDVHELSEPYDLVICAGGLYHITDTPDFIRQLRKFTTGALVVQSAITLETEDPDYFEVRGPGRPHGCSFTFGWLGNALKASGFEVVASDRNELTGNPHPRDRGSAYFLCR